MCVCVDCRAHASQFSATPKALSERSQSNDIKETTGAKELVEFLAKIGTCFYQFNRYLLYDCARGCEREMCPWAISKYFGD
jgi:hypothetical protein